MAAVLKSFRVVSSSLNLIAVRSVVTRATTCAVIRHKEIDTLSQTKRWPILSKKTQSVTRSQCAYTTKVTPEKIQEITDRVLKVCGDFDRVTADKLTVDSHFIEDLGLDSLDHVEVVMAMEDEFGFEIPDEDAEKLLRPRDIVQYVCDKEDVYD